MPKEKQIDLKSSVEGMGRVVTQIVTFIGGTKKTIPGIKTETIRQGQFTKYETLDGRLVMINDANVLCVEVFTEKMAINLKVKYLVKDIPKLAYAKGGDAAFDLFAAREVVVRPMEIVQVSTGIALEIPEGHVGLIWDKSGLAQKFGLKTLGGVVDAGYRGEVMVGIINLSKNPYKFEKGHKVAQMIIQKRGHCDIVEVDELSSSERGSDGFGSTGK